MVFCGCLLVCAKQFQMALRFDERDSLDCIFGYFFIQIMTTMPNKLLQATAAAPVSCD